MISEFADLHIHTKYSDGTDTVEELLKQVLTTDIRTISITDHDTAGAIPEAQKLGKSLGIEVIAGIELSTLYKKKDVHLLGYFFDPHDKKLLAYCDKFREVRETRAAKMVHRLNTFGIDITMADVEAIADGAVIGRPHIAQAIVEGRFARNFQEVFDKYIANDGPAYVDKFNIEPGDAIKLIHDAGGIVSLAHPLTVGDDGVVAFLHNLGLDGLEVYHPQLVMAGCVKHYHILASRYGLLVSGGSDWHGRRKPHIKLGQAKVHLSHVEQMREVAKKQRK